LPALTFTDADANVTDLNDGTIFKLLGIRDAGIPALWHQTVKTPSRDGETYIRSQLEQRFLILELAVIGTSFTNLQTHRRTLITALNPKTGVGTLKWTPDATVYAIDCIVEQGVGFRRHLKPLAELATVSLRCSDPTWYNPTINEETVANSGSGLSVPITVPLSFADGEGTTVINNVGDVASRPTITVPGACTNPIITNTTTGKKLQFVGLTINGGQSLIIDCDLRTAKIGSTSHIDKLSADSEFWALEPGNNTVTFGIDSGTVTADVDYYTRWIGV
jgi:hypothetical protein